MKKMTWLLSLLLAVSIIFSGCGEIPDEISSDISDSSSSIELTKQTESEQSIPDSEPEVSTDSTPTESPLYQPKIKQSRCRVFLLSQDRPMWQSTIMCRISAMMIIRRNRMNIIATLTTSADVELRWPALVKI